MAKKDSIEKSILTVNDGIRFGLGFFIVNLAGFAAIGLVAWIVTLLARSFGFVL